MRNLPRSPSWACASVLLVSLAACGKSNVTTTPGADGGTSTGADCPSGLSKKMVGGVEMCIRTPTLAAVGYDEGVDTTTCGDPVAIDVSCFANRPTAPATPATVTLEGYVDTFGLEKATTSTNIEVQTPSGTIVGSVASDANHRCARTKTVGAKTVIVAGYTLANVPTNQLLVFKNTGQEFKPTYIFGQHFDTTLCQNVQDVPDDTMCRSGCFRRNGQIILRHDTNIISNQTWTLIPLTAGYSRGIAPGNAAIAGQLHDCKDNQLRNASVAFTPNAIGKIATYFNGNCEDPNANNAELFSNRDSLYAVLDATPGNIKVSGEALVGGSLVNLGVYDVQLFPNSVTILTLRGPPPLVVADGGI